MVADVKQRVLENRLRRMAERQGLKLVKSRRRDPRAYDYQGWMIVDKWTHVVVAGSGPPADFAMSAEEVEAYLLGDDES